MNFFKKLREGLVPTPTFKSKKVLPCTDFFGPFSLFRGQSVFSGNFSHAKQFKSRCGGFSVVEILVAAGIFVTAVSVFLFAFGFLDDLSDRATERARAALLLEEGAEAVLLLRDQGWDTYIDALDEEETYYLYYNGSAYSTSESEQLIFNTYFRTITIFSVNRDANDSYSESGTDDPNTKRVRIEIIRASDDAVITSAEMLVHNAYE